MNIVFKNKICNLLGYSEQEFDNIFSQKPYRGIRINTLKANVDMVQKGFDFKLESAPFYKHSYYIPKDFEGIGNSPLHHAGAFYVQEPSASSVLSVVNAKPGEKILDLCAAPGGKSTGIGAALEGKGLLWANEFIRKRATALLSNIERIGISNAVVSSLSVDYLCSELCEFFDAVVVDAPCSGEGMWRHNEQVEKQWSNEYVAECAALQRQILSSAVNAVKHGGRLIYSTCTFSREENEDNVEWFLKEFPQFTLEKIDEDFGSQGLSENEEINKKVKRILPTDKGEGHFIALFKKLGSVSENFTSKINENISIENKKIVTEFLNENFLEFNSGCFFEKNNLVYLVNEDMPFLKGDVLRFGVLLGEIRKGRLEPAHSLFNRSGVVPKRVLNLELNDSRLYSFLRGEEISADLENGYTAVRVEGIPLGFGKVSGKRLTNKYPKGLRLL